MFAKLFLPCLLLATAVLVVWGAWVADKKEELKNRRKLSSGPAPSRPSNRRYRG